MERVQKDLEDMKKDLDELKKKVDELYDIVLRRPRRRRRPIGALELCFERPGGIYRCHFPEPTGGIAPCYRPEPGTGGILPCYRYP